MREILRDLMQYLLGNPIGALSSLIGYAVISFVALLTLAMFIAPIIFVLSGQNEVVIPKHVWFISTMMMFFWDITHRPGKYE